MFTLLGVLAETLQFCEHSNCIIWHHSRYLKLKPTNVWVAEARHNFGLNYERVKITYVCYFSVENSINLRTRDLN